MGKNTVVFGTVFVATLIALAVKPWVAKFTSKAA
jgi:hypothetical protein